MHQYRPPLTKTNKILIVTLVSLFIVHAIFHQFSGAYFKHFFALNGGTFFSGLVFQIVTYPFFASGIFELLFDGLILWFLGGELERIWGKSKYIYFLITSVTFGGLLFLAVTSFLPAWPSLSGPGALTYPLLIAYGILFPERDLLLIFFPVKAKYFCLIILAIQLYMGFFSPYGVNAWGNLGAMLGAVIWMIWMTKNASKTKKRKVSKKSSHLRLVKEDDDDDKPKYFH